MRAKLSSAASTPITTRTRPAADSTAPTLSKGCVRSAGRGSSMARLSHRIAATTSAWNTKAARQLMAVVMRPPISGPAAAPMPPIPVMMPKALARDVKSVSRIVVRM